MLDKQLFIDRMTGLCEIYNKQPSEYLLSIYYDILKNYSDERVSIALNTCIRTHKYNTLPKPAEILSFIEESREEKALRAWLYVLEAVKKAGYYGSVEFKDKIIHHCIDNLGGWMWFCSQEKEQMPFVEKRFLDLYVLFSKREVSDHPRLLGFYETKNSGKYEGDIPKIIKIGFRDKEQTAIEESKEAPHAPLR